MINENSLQRINKKGYFSKKEIYEYFFIYTLIFIGLSIIIFSFFWRYDKSFIWNQDGKQQHFRALVYYGQWLREIIKNIFVNHSFSIPEWSFSLGYGSDIITTLHYYVVGDPFSLLSAFVPSKYTVYLYGFLILLRLYSAGLTFSAYCFKVTKTSRLGVLSGSFIYVFSAFGLVASVRHPYFTNPMIFFPLILLGIEKIIDKKSPFVFIIAVFLSCISNFYFFYMIVLLTVIYVVIRLFMLYRKNELLKAVLLVLKLLFYAVLGIMMASIILIPVLSRFFGDARLNNDYVYDFLYPKSYYEGFFSAFLSFASNGYWSFMGYTGISLITISLLFLKKKQNTAIKFGFILLSIMLLFPVFGHIFNGFSYITNRWIWGYSFLIALILVFVWEDLFQLNKKELCVISGILFAYFLICCLLKVSRTENAMASLVIAAVALVLLGQCCAASNYHKKIIPVGTTLLVVLSVCVTALYGYAPSEFNYVSEFININQVNNDIFTTQDHAVQLGANEIEDQSFLRYSGPRSLELNESMQGGLSSTVYYWSLSNSNMINLYKEMGLQENSNYLLKSLDNRTILNALTSVNYYVLPNENSNEPLPYGFSHINNYSINGKKYSVYHNNNALPLGYTYSSYITRDVYENLLPSEKQEVMGKSVVLDKDVDANKNSNLKFDSLQIPYRITKSDGITIDGNNYLVTKEGATITLHFEGLQYSETYLYVNFDEKSSEVSLPVTAKSDAQTTKNIINFITNSSQLYGGRHEFLINFGYEKDSKKEIIIQFAKPGEFILEDISVICQPMENFSKSMDDLRAESLKNIMISEDNIKGDIHVSSSKILFLSIPYSRGWTAYVDGEKAELLKANTMFMALPISEGDHRIELVYKTPLLKISAIISLTGFVLFFSLIVLRKITQNKDKKSKT